MAGEQHKLDVEISADATKAIQAFDATAGAARKFEGTLNSAHKALQNFSKVKGGKTKLLGEDQAKQLERTLKVYQQLTGAVNSYGRAVKGLAGVDQKAGAKNIETAMRGMAKALQSVGAMSEQDRKQKMQSLAVYKQLTQVVNTHTSSLKNEAAAIRSVAAARAASTKANTDPRALTEQSMAAAYAQNAAFDKKRQRDINAAYAHNAALDKKRQAEAQRMGALQVRAQREMEAALNKRTTATVKANKATAEGASPQTRYALYEVAAAYTAIAAAAAAVPVATSRAAIAYEDAFSNVERTTLASQSALGSLRSELMQMTSDIPVAFAELSRISTLGAQMGIDTENLDEFTETVAKFAASTNVTAEQGAMSFGRLNNMLKIGEENYHALGSAIAEVGVASVATETEILANAESIATTANMAGFTADEVVGLSTALASLKVRPEMSRGAMQRVFAKINSAVADGGEELQNWADVAGIAAEQADAMWREDPSQFFQAVVQGLAEETDNIQRNITMRDKLGVTNVRDIELLSRLSNGYDVYAESMTLASDAYARGDFLDKAFDIRAATTAAHLQRLANSFQSLLASFGEGNLPVIDAVATVLINLFDALRTMPGPVKSGVSMLALLTAGLFALKAAMALAMASMIAFRQITKDVGLQGGITFSTLRQQAAVSFGAITAGARQSTYSLATFRASLAATTGVANKTKAAVVGVGASMKASPVGWVIGLGTAVATLWALVDAANAAETANKKAADSLIDSMGGMDTLMDALQQDAAELASGTQSKVYGNLNVTLKEREEAALSTAAVVKNTLLPAERSTTEAVEANTAAIQDNIGAIGERTNALMRQAIVDSKVWDAVDPERMQNLLEQGFDLDKWTTLWIEQGQADADQYVHEFQVAMNEGILALGDVVTTEEQLGMQDAAQTVEQFRGAVSDLNPVLEASRVRMAVANALGLEYSDVTEEMTEDTEALSEEVDVANEMFEKLIGNLFGVVGAQAAVQDSLQSLGEAIADNGLDFSVASEAGRANLAELESTVQSFADYMNSQVEAGNMTADQAALEFAHYVESLFQQLEQMGVDPEQFVEFRNLLGNIFENNPVAVNINTEAALQNLQNLASYGAAVFQSLRNQGVSKGMSASGARYSAQAAAYNASQGKTTTGHGFTIAPMPKQVKTPFEPIDFAALAYGKATKAAENLADEEERVAKEAEEAGRAAEKAAEDTMTAAEEAADYVKRLGEAFDESFNKKYGLANAQDAVELQLIKMRKAAEDSAQAVRDLREEQRKLNQDAADARIEQRQAGIFAGVARQYGDTERYLDYSNQEKAAKATVAEKTRLANAAGKEAAELDKNRLALTGMSEAAIENRSRVQDLQRAMAELIEEYAATGATQQQVRDYAEQLRRKFVDQVTQMGYNETQVRDLSTVFQNLKADITNVPRKVEIKTEATGVDATRRAIDELTRDRTVPLKFSAQNQDLSLTGDLFTKSVVSDTFRTKVLEGNGPTNTLRYPVPNARGGIIPGRSPVNKYRDNLMAVGHNYDGAVSVQSGEGIVNRQALARYGGEDWLDAVNTMRLPAYTAPVASAGGSGGGNSAIQLVELLPNQIGQIARAVSTILTVDGKMIAGTTNRNNQQESFRGAH